MSTNVYPRRRSRRAMTRGSFIMLLAAAAATAGCGTAHPSGAPASGHAAAPSTAIQSTGTAATPITLGPTTPPQPQIIRIATDLPAASEFGTSEQDAVQLAVDDATDQNLLPGYRLTPVSDTGPEGVLAAIADPSVVGLVGPVTSAQATVDLPAGSTAPLTIISPSAGDQPAGAVPTFRLAVPAGAQGAALADFTVRSRSLHTAYVIDDTQTDDQALAAGFIAQWQLLGGQLTGRASVPAGTPSYLNLLTQAAVTRPDLVFYAGAATTGGIDIRRQMQMIPALKNTTFAGSDGLHTTTFAQTIGPSSPTFSATAGPDGSDDAAFRTEFVARFGAGAISTYSAAAYDSTMILVHAIKTALVGGEFSRTAVLSAVAATSYRGTGATWSFDAAGGPKPSIVTIYTLATAAPPQGDGWQFVAQVCPTC